MIHFLFMTHSMLSVAGRLDHVEAGKFAGERDLTSMLLTTNFEDEPLELQVSRALLQPFVPLLSHHGFGPSEPRSGFVTHASGTRVALSEVNRCLETAPQDLGLRALGLVEAGSCDVTEYLAASASSWGEALEVITKYSRILSDAAEYCLHEHAQRAVFEVQSRARLSRPLADFQVGLIALAARAWLRHTNNFEFWFAHERPHNLAEYTRVYGAAPLRFGAPCNAIVFDKDLLRAPLRDANPKLHAVLRRHADSLLGELPPIDLLTGRVRELVLQLLPAGKSDVRHAAERLNMSRRTLARRLKVEGASYREVVEDARHALARRYLAMPTLDVKEIAFLLGYSETAAFSRAFRRWAGQSPLQYRESHARGLRTRHKREG